MRGWPLFIGLVGVTVLLIFASCLWLSRELSMIVKSANPFLAEIIVL
jgi:hypothetical protein